MRTKRVMVSAPHLKDEEDTYGVVAGEDKTLEAAHYSKLLMGQAAEAT